MKAGFVQERESDTTLRYYNLNEKDDEPWPVIKDYFYFLYQMLHFSGMFLRHLLQNNLIDETDHEFFLGSNSHEEKVHHLLVTVLPTKPPEKLTDLCNIFSIVEQPHVARRLKMYYSEVELCPQGLLSKICLAFVNTKNIYVLQECRLLVKANLRLEYAGILYYRNRLFYYLVM